MPSQGLSVGLKDAIVHSVEHGTYPESEEISSAELPPSVYSDLLTNLQTARDEVKADIRQLSKDVAPDVDGWIAQAKKLQEDIERSKATARDIVQEAEAGKRLKAEASEAANKAALLEKEVSFSETLVHTLQQLKDLKQVLNCCQDAMVQGDLATALATLKQFDASISDLAAVENTRAYDLLQKRCRGLKDALAEQSTRRARLLVDVSVVEKRLVVSIDPADSMHTIATVVDTLTFLSASDGFVKRLRRDLDSAIIQPLISAEDGEHRAIHVDGGTLSAVKREGDASAITILDDIWSMLSFLKTNLPVNVCSPLSERLLPPLVDELTAKWLDPCVPISIDETPVFQQVLDRVSRLADQIDTLQWSASADSLREWVQSAPKTWLAKRRETALGAVRTLLFTKLNERNTVERVETQMVSKGDALMTGSQDVSDDAWDAAWDEEDAPTSPVATKTPSRHGPIEDDEDEASAWGLEDDELGQAVEGESGETSEIATVDEDNDADADAWGWGDEEPAGEPDSQSRAEPDIPQQPDRTKPSPGAPANREITLKETYTVTNVPDGILDIIKQSVHDAETLMNGSYTHTPIGPAASALYTLPTFALAMYRATASTAYGRLESGSMLIYNDSTRLADQLRSYIAQQAEKDETSNLRANQRASTRMKLETDIKALDLFARRAYSSDMESQRMILNDMLDGAQGFVNCTVEPFASGCESAVEITAGRLRDVHKQWEPILSRSALLQSLGSLLSTAVSKLIMDIEDLSDIGEEESKKLKSLCDILSGVKELFVQKHPEHGQHGDMTGIYCPNWFKFQYLGEILDASLADIKYLWIDGELRLEFDADEVVDLIQALFADSDYRRKAIADIRRAG